MAQGDRPGKKPFDPARAKQIKANIARGAKDVGAGIVKEEIFGIPGAFADLSGLAQFVTNPFTYGTSEKLQTASEDLIGDLGASALAAKAGVELSDEIFDEEGNIRPEMVGRFLAPGALYAKGATLAPGIGRLFTQVTKTRGSGIEVKGSGNIEMGASSTPGKYDEFFENMGEEGAGMEFPAVGQAVDSYVTEFDPKKSFDLLDGALKSEDYPGYATILRANLDRQFPGEKISVSRTENYSDPRAGIEGRRSKTFFEVDKDDVLFAGSDSERELIIRGPKGTYNEGGPMSVRIEEAPPSDLEPLPSEELSDLTTPELLTSWTIEPSKVNRAEVAARIKGDPEATARSNQALDDLGYGDTVPMYRVIKLTDDGEMKPESLISATLDPSKVPTNAEFLIQGKFSMTTPTEYRVVRYDVPRDRVAGYLPALSGDITQKVNKAVKKKGFGQEKVEGLKTVTNPAKHAKSLLDMQDEIIADVSGLEPRVLSDEGKPLNMLSMERMLPSAVASGEIKTVDDFSTAMGFGNYSVLNPLDFKGDPEAFQAAERAARQKAIDEYSDFFGLEKTAPKKEVLEGEVVGTKSKKYMKLEKELGEARTPELRAARELNMETQGVQDAFDLNAANNIDKNFEFASGGDDVRATSDEFIGGVIDEYQGARDQGFNRGDALVDAIRVKVRDYNEIYPNALNENSVLDDIAKNVNDDFGFDAALSRFREAQTNRNALEAELQTAKFKNVREAQEAATRVREEQLGIAGLSDSEKAAFYRNMGEQEQRGIAGIGIPEPETPKPNLRLVKKAKGGPVDMRSGVGDLFRVYS